MIATWRTHLGNPELLESAEVQGVNDAVLFKVTIREAAVHPQQNNLEVHHDFHLLRHCLQREHGDDYTDRESEVGLVDLVNGWTGWDVGVVVVRESHCLAGELVAFVLAVCLLTETVYLRSCSLQLVTRLLYATNGFAGVRVFPIGMYVTLLYFLVLLRLE